MIIIKKAKKPQILIDNDKKWTEEYCKAVKIGVVPEEIANRYKHKEIKAALEKETSGKCAYCESKIAQVSYGDIEHILPKNKNARPDLYVDWSNLTISCEVCNRSGKRDYYNPKQPLINPYIDNPTDHFQDIGPMIFPILGDSRAFITVDVLKLNRMPLIERRTERIQAVESMLSAWKREKDVAIREILAKQIQEECRGDKEYSSTVIAFLEARGFLFENSDNSNSDD